MTYNNPIPISKKNFQKIIQFYLFESPVRTFQKKKKDVYGSTPDQPHPKYNYTFQKVSKRGMTFAERNLDGARLNSLRAAMFRTTDVKLAVVDEKELEHKADDFAVNDEYIIILRNSDRISVTEGIFYCIRNAFAHGDFNVVGNMYYFKNEHNNKIKGLARISERNLLMWIELVNMNIDDIKKAG